MAQETDSNQGEQVPLDEAQARVLAGQEMAALGELLLGDIEPPVTDEPAKYSRRGFLWRVAAVGGLAAVELAGLYGLDRFGQARKVQQSVDQYLRAKFRALPKLPQLKAAIPKAPNIIPAVDLDKFSSAHGISGPINIRIGAVGTSNTFALGTMNDKTGPEDQPHSAPQVAAESATNTMRQSMGMNTIEVWTGAIPGADSGEGNKEDPRGLYGVLTQLRNPDFQQWLLDAGAHDLVVVRRETFGLDDLRKLAKTVDQMVGILSDIFRLATSSTVDRDIKQTIDFFGKRLQVIADEFGQNLVAGADIVAGLSQQRIRAGKSGIILNEVYTWDVGVGDGVPFSAIEGHNNDPRVSHILKPDLIDPEFPDRYFLDLNAIPYGHQIATWAWTLMFEAQNKAIAEISKRHPELITAIEDLTEVNRVGSFYYVHLPGQQPWPKGDGHPGVKQDGVSGIQQIAAKDLALYTRQVHGLGKVTADRFAQFQPIAS